MKAFILSLLILFSANLQGDAEDNNEVRLSGKVENSNKEVLTLTYAPFFRGTLSYDSFHPIAATISKSGKFILKSDRITEFADYSLQIKDTSIKHLIFFKGDKVDMHFDMNNIKNSFFAKGKGAGKINVLQLEQFQSKGYNNAATIEEHAATLDSVITARLTLLKAIYLKDIDNDAVKNAANKDKIESIIKLSPLSKREYDLLITMVNLIRYDIEGIITSDKRDPDEEIKLETAYFNAFNSNEYKKLENINHWYAHRQLINILKVEYLKTLKQDLYFKEWDNYFNNRGYEAWTQKYLKENFNADVNNKYYADITAWLMTLGHDYEEPLKYINENYGNSVYNTRVNNFKILLDTGLKTKQYNLSLNTATLNQWKLDKLLEKSKGKNTLVVFWSAQFAGSTVLEHIPSISHLQKQHNLKVFYIAVDNSEYRNLWAARIIDSNWNGEHYFMPVEDNKTAKNICGNKDIYSLCSGGASYTFISTTGIINNNIENPIALAGGKIFNYINE